MSNVWKWSRRVFPDGLVPGPGSAADASEGYEAVMRAAWAWGPGAQKTRRMADCIAEFDVATRTAMAAHLPVKELTQVAPVLLGVGFRTGVFGRWEELGPPVAVLSRARTERVPVAALRLAVAHAGSSVWSARWVAHAGLLDEALEEVIVKASNYRLRMGAEQGAWRLRAAFRRLTVEEVTPLVHRYAVDGKRFWVSYVTLGGQHLADVALPGVESEASWAHPHFPVLVRDVAELLICHVPDSEAPTIGSHLPYDIADVCAEPSTHVAQHVRLWPVLDTTLGRDVSMWERFVADVATCGPHVAAVNAGILT